MNNIILSSLLIAYAFLIGLVVIAASYVIINYVVSKKTPKKKSRKHLKVIK